METLMFLVLFFQLKPVENSAAVPLMLNGHMLITENLDQSNHQIVFKRMGDFATEVEFHHIHIPVDLMAVETTADVAIRIIQSYSDNIYQETVMHYHKDNRYPEEDKAKSYSELITNQNNFVTNNSLIILHQLQEALISMTDALPQSSSKLDKRQLGFLFGLAGTAFATENAERIFKLEKADYNGDQRVQTLTHITEIQENHLSHLDIKINSNERQILEALRYDPAMLTSSTNVLIFKTWDIVTRIQATVQQAQINRLSTSLLQGHTINKMFEFLGKAAESRGMKLMIQKPVDLFQIEMSYFYRPQDKKLNLFLHVPMVHSDNLLHFFKLVPFPISNAIKSNYSMTLKLEHQLIAVGADHQFQLVNELDLQSCDKYGTSYLCQGRHTTRTDLENTCLGALYLEKWSVITKLCKFEFIPAAEHVFRLSSNKWIVSAPDTFSTTVKCNKVFTTVNLKHLTIVTVPEGCSMHLKTHIIHPGTYIADTDIEVKHFQWTWQPSHIFPNFNTKAFNNTMNSLEDTSSIEIDYINHEIKMKRDNEIESRNLTLQLIQEPKNIGNIRIPSEINLAFLITLFIMNATVIVYIVKRDFYPKTKTSKQQAMQDTEMAPRAQHNEQYTEPNSIENREYNPSPPYLSRGE